MNTRFISIVAASAAASALLAACGVPQEEETPVTLSPAETTESVALPETEATEPEQPEAGTSPHDPLPAGSPVQVPAEAGVWEVVIGEPDPAAAAEYADWFEVGQGEVLVYVPVKATYNGEGNASPGSDLTFSYVTADGASYDADPLGMGDTLMNAGDVFNGGTAEGYVVFVIPATSEPGAWWVKDWYDEGGFVEAPAIQ